MKKTISTILAIVAIVAMSQAENNIKPEQFSVGITSTLILPSVNPTTFTDYSIQTDWTNLISFSGGDYVRIMATNGVYSGADYYWCITAGSSTNTYPTWSMTSDVTNGTAVFRYVWPRKSFTAMNIGTGRVSFAYGSTPVAGYGFTAGPLNYIEKNYLGEVYAISGTSTNLVGVQQSLQSK